LTAASQPARFSLSCAIAISAAGVTISVSNVAKPRPKTIAVDRLIHHCVEGAPAAIFLLPFLTAGRVHIEPGNPPIKFRWHGVHRLPNGKIVLQADLAGFVGLLLVAAFIAIGVVVYVNSWQ
jgi:hypothetical protein